jgi:hypothetical protein
MGQVVEIIRQFHVSGSSLNASAIGQTLYIHRTNLIYLLER